MITLVEGVEADAGQLLPEIDGYAIHGLVGRGGMGTVYRATQLSLAQPVAIKVLAEAFRSQPSFVARFQREARLQVSLQHPHVVPVIESGSSDGLPYIVMRYIDGLSLRELVGGGALPVRASAELLTGIASALDHAHARGILHLDVKPHNVLVEGERHAWLADFGLTRMLEESTGLTLTGLVGTFDYLAPEIARGEPATAASDIYSLAVTTFQCLTGVLPFPVAHQAAAVFAHASAERPRASELRPGLPESLDLILQRGMAVMPAERQRTAGELLDDVREALGLGRAGAGLLRLPAEAEAAPRWAAEFPTSAPTAAAGGQRAAVARGSRLARRDGPIERIGRIRGIERIGRRRVAAGAAGLAVLAGAGTTIGLLASGGRAPAQPGKTYAETVGGQAHNWLNYRLATGPEGPLIPSHATIRIACRLHGYRVQDGNTWWYRIASRPWNGRYYVSADAFYNNGHTSGSLHGTPFVDFKVPKC